MISIDISYESGNFFHYTYDGVTVEQVEKAFKKVYVGATITVEKDRVTVENATEIGGSPFQVLSQSGIISFSGED